MESADLVLQPQEKLLIDRRISPNTTLTLHNPSSSSIAFKVCAIQLKTNVPEAYVVRPNQGILLANETMVVTLSFKGTVPKGGKAHKFSVQTALTNLDPNNTQGQLELWKNTAIAKSQAVLTVVFADQEPSKEDVKTDNSKEDSLLVSMMPSEETKAVPASSFQTAVSGIPIAEVPLPHPVAPHPHPVAPHPHPVAPHPHPVAPAVTTAPVKAEAGKGGWSVSHLALLVVAVIVGLKAVMVVFGQ